MLQNSFSKQFNYLNCALTNDKLHHSYIFYGPKGSGKFEFALYFSRFIQCLAEKKDKPCEKCANCKVSKNGYVINTYVINKGKKESISIDEIRELQKSMDLSVGSGNRKIFIINNAQNLGKEARDSLLKKLEEPTGKSLIILVTDEKKLLPKTILSRSPAIFFSQGLGEVSFIKEIEIEELNELTEEIRIILGNSLYQKMILVKDLNLDKGISEKLEKWILVLYNLLLLKEGLSSPINEEMLKNLEKNLNYDKIIKVLESLCLTLNNLDTNVSKKVLFEDLVLNIGD